MRTELLKAVIAAGVFSVAGICNAGPPPSPQVTVVTDLYKHFAYEAVLEEPGNSSGFLDSPPSVLGNYLTQELTELILRDRKCASDTREICRLDWLPIWSSQDPAGVTVKVKAGSKPNEVKAELRYGKNVKTLTYSVTLQKVGWRVANISYGKERATLMDTLSAPM